MSKGGGIKVAKGILYILSCVVAVIITVLLIMGVYNTAMNTMNVNMMVKDAFAKRAQTVLLPSADGSDRIMLEKLFALRVIQTDEMLNSHYYDGYEIVNYYEDTDVEFHIVWPWDDEITVKVTEKVRDIKGNKLVETDDAEAEDVPAIEEKPLSWRNGIYEVTLKKDKVTEAWKIYELKLVEPMIVEEDSTTSFGGRQTTTA